MAFKKFKFNKLVRDNIIHNMIESGDKPKYSILNNKEYVEELIKKLVEESTELTVEKIDLLVEIADIQEVIDSLIVAIGKDKTDLTNAQLEKNKKQGSFNERIYIKEVEVSNKNPWIKHLSANPLKYPEVK
jgi:predicted house-cleaning noncanonical NTP pyrophosphatase (MazG superfamily)